jgi:hypothetical protein
MTIKRFAPGLYADAEAGNDLTLEMHRNLEWALSKTTNIVNFQVEANDKLAIVQHEDSTAAIDALLNDDLVGVQRRLAAQAIATDQIFHSLSCVASVLLKKGDKHELAVPLMKTALKAQENSRKSLIALAELKRPKKGATFIKTQQNAVLVQPEQAAGQPKPIKQMDGASDGRVDFGEATGSQRTGLGAETLEAQHRATD